jgi:peptide/nickel transport system permease protein
VSASQTLETSVPVLRTVPRAAGWAGLCLIALAVALTDFLVPATEAGPMLRAPSGSHAFGTDILGRDMFGETLHGLRETMLLSSEAAVIAIVLGGLAGALASRTPRPLGLTLRAALGVFAAIPPLLLTILVIGLSARHFAPMAAGIAAAPFAFVRAFDRTNAGSVHAKYARATGIAAHTLIRRDLTYAFRDTFASTAARAFAAVTIILSTASFLGFGATPPARDLGLMIAAAKTTYMSAWWTAAFPALALVLLIFCARLAAGLEEGERP